jgi:hypothetical protein
VKEKIFPFPLSCTHARFSLAQSPQTGRGQKIQVPQSLHFCIINLPALAPSQKGWLTGVSSGSGFRVVCFSSAMTRPQIDTDLNRQGHEAQQAFKTFLRDLRFPFEKRLRLPNKSHSPRSVIFIFESERRLQNNSQ